jgi:hypothetical protein
VGEIGASGEISSGRRKNTPNDAALLLTTGIEANAAWVIRTALGDERFLEGPISVLCTATTASFTSRVQVARG